MGLNERMMFGRGENPEAGDFVEQSPTPIQNIEDERFDRKKVIDFMHISEAEQDEFRERVKANDGTVILAIHPFYDIYTEMLYPNPYSEKLSPEKLEKTNRIRRILKKLLGGDAANTPPVVVFEEYEHQGITKPAIEGYTGDSNTAYYVDTLYDNATPIMDPSENIKRSDYTSESFANAYRFDTDAMEIAKRNYQILTDNLKAAEVKRVIIGGMDLIIRDIQHEQRLVNDDGTFTKTLEKYIQEERTPHLHLRACVAQTFYALNKKFETRISNFTAPNNASDVAKIVEQFNQKEEKDE